MSDILTPLASIQAPDAAEMTTGANAALAMVQAWQITDETTYGLGAEELRAIKAKRKALEEKRTSMTVPLNGVLKSINALFKGPDTLLEQAESIIKGKMISYTDEIERQQREAAQAAAKAAAEAEAAAMAAAADAQDDVAEAAMELAVAAAAAAPVVLAPVRAAGISKTMVRKKGRVTDKAAFLKAIAEVPAYHALVDVNEGAINKLVAALGGGLAIPGIEIYEEKTLSARAA
jgi:hypothetical protein